MLFHGDSSYPNALRFIRTLPVSIHVQYVSQSEIQLAYSPHAVLRDIRPVRKVWNAYRNQLKIPEDRDSMGDLEIHLSIIFILIDLDMFASE